MMNDLSKLTIEQYRALIKSLVVERVFDNEGVCSQINKKVDREMEIVIETPEKL